jgi:hypothetical protein
VIRAEWGSAELLGQCDDDALRTADVTKPLAVLVLLQFANEFGAVSVQAGEDVLDIFDSEHDATYAQRVRWRVSRLSATQRPSIGAFPSSSIPSSAKNAVAAARSLTTTLTWFIRWIVMAPSTGEGRRVAGRAEEEGSHQGE